MFRGTGLLIAALCIGTALRFYALGAKGLWLDEALSWRLSQFPVPELVERTGQSGTVHPPAYFLLLRLWTTCFGDSEFVMRTPSALLGGASIVALWVMVRALGNLPQALVMRENPGQRSAAADAEQRDSRTQAADPQYVIWARAADLAAMLLALSPLHIHLSKQIRGYTLATFLLCTSSYLLLRALSARSARSCVAFWAFYVATTVAACYTHHLLLVSLAAQAIFVVLFLFRPRALRSELRDGWCGGETKENSSTNSLTPRACFPFVRGRRIAAVTAFTLIAVLYSPWLPCLWRQSESVRSSWVRTLQAHDAARQAYAAVLGTPASRATEPIPVAWSVVGLVLATQLLVAWRFGWAGLFGALSGLIPVIFLLVYSANSIRSIFDCRYLVFPQMFWLTAFAMVAAMVQHLPERWLVAVFFIGCSGASLWDNWDVLGAHSRPGVRNAVRLVLDTRRPGEPVCVLSPLLFFTAAYYMRHEPDHPWYVAPIQERRKLRGWTHLRDDEILATGEHAIAHWPSVWVIANPPIEPDKFGWGRNSSAASSVQWSFQPELHNRWESSIVVVHYEKAR